ncbi:MAG: metal ABC transporter permease [Hyphomicrobiaceae bacterium]|nr:metal ABC transporter permease [Hyphomicrobiaceae bacterium]
MILEPFLLRALAAAIGLALVAAPLGALVVWQRMAYFGETMAQASLLGVALSMALGSSLTVSVLIVAVLAALIILLLSRQRVLPLDSVLGLMHHGSLAAGVIATAALAGQSVDLLGYLFGDIFAVTSSDLVWIYAGGTLVLLVLGVIWQPLLRLAVHEELAMAEGVPGQRIKAVFMLLLAVTIAIAIKILGILLVIAFLIVPAAAARPFARTPEQMVGLTALVAVAGVAGGLAFSARSDAPGGPAIVLVLALLALVSLVRARALDKDV